ncbi:SDR family NAD(P)-dependent oxidoreductase [Salinibacter ruber]|uniref:3-oxoacyl-[acyl-carrier protein] reductase n=1 Tax=Salinibacter ruber TaxID=146919 RepID=A0A9X2Q979_9BACT|nr:3-oxoacyl-ACP reductase family protein [Salinibacter ruber]MCS3661164.1 3-oxoacyl-[acyl-carrier protein] reductase [Salinibacter ruber]MCS3710963.1 3-oxoacyl-[acyl-carrier protein] reductase [Salinibacter ruber]
MKKCVVVTGGSKGLGKAIVKKFLSNEKYNVATFSRSETDFIRKKRKENKDRFTYRSVDISERQSVRSFVNEVSEKYGSVDVLVNNAGVARDDVLALQPTNDMDSMIDINLKGTLEVTKSCVRKMLPQRSGRIINITSIVGQSGYRGLSVYSVTKSGLDGLTRSMARELGGRGITVNSIAPGFLKTEMTQALDESQRDQIIRRTPMGRLGTTEDVVGLVCFLASSKAEFITGQTIAVDGGITA